MNARDARIEAGAAEFAGFTPNPGLMDMRSRLLNAGCRYTAKRIIDASDEVMFSDRAVERLAKTLFELHPIAKGCQPWDALGEESRIRINFMYDARAVIAALKGEA